MTITCAESVLPEIEGTNSIIVVVDNFSNDGSVDKIQQWLDQSPEISQVKLVASLENTGFSGGNNIGMSKVSADYFVLLNSDTLVRPGALNTLLQTFDIDPRIGLASPRLEDEDGTGQVSCFRYHSPVSELINAAKTGPITKLFAGANVPMALVEGISYPQWTSFACVAIRQQVIKDIGLMDETYFLYYEDTDFCRVLMNHGWKVANNPRAHVVHYRGGSAELKEKVRQKKRLPRYHFESRSYYYRKHYGVFGPLLANMMWTTGRVMSKSRELIGGKPRAASEREWRDIWINCFTSKDK